MKHLICLLLVGAVGVPGFAASGRDGAVPFSRIYKAGEKTVYATKLATKVAGQGGATLVTAVTTQKLLPKGRAKLLFHWSNMQLQDNFNMDLPADVTLDTSDNNMAGKYQPTMGSVDYLAAVLQLASVTADKPVSVGDETPFSWGGDNLGFKGTVKLLEVTPDKHQMKALIKAKMLIQGKEIDDITLTSTYDRATCRMLTSTGSLVSVMDFKFSSNPE